MPRPVVPTNPPPSSFFLWCGSTRCASCETQTRPGSRRAASSSSTATNAHGSTTMPPPRTETGRSCSVPQGRWWSLKTSPPTTTVCPAFAPPEYLTTTSASWARASTTLPLPSSPHCAPMMAMPGTLPPRAARRAAARRPFSGVTLAPRAGRGQSNLSAMTTPADARPTVLLSTSTVPRTTSLRRDDAMTGRNYSLAVARAGGLPLMVANLDPALAAAYARGADALLLTGGGDLDPELFGEAPDRDLGSVDPERDAFELALYAAFREAGKPVLGVCRGCQVINVAHGGKLHQHLPSVDGTHQHDQRDLRGFPAHPVELEPGSRLAAAYGATRVRTNTYHHQAIATVGAGL